VEQVVTQLQDDITKMKGHRAAFMRRMEQREREFREWRAARERELAQLRRSAQRQNAALQQHQAMHLKQQVRGPPYGTEAGAARRGARRAAGAVVRSGLGQWV
jgi:hypothetical protein